jgi:hypothetical protein
MRFRRRCRFRPTRSSPRYSLSNCGAGSYLASAVVVLASNDPEFHLVDCALAVDGGIIAPVSSGAIGGQPNNFLTLPLLLGVKLENQEQTLSVVCRTNVDNIVVSQPTSLAALRVGSIQ